MQDLINFNLKRDIEDTKIPQCPCPNLVIQHHLDDGSATCTGNCPSDYERAKALCILNNDRWSEGIEHHPKSVQLMKFLKEHDEKDFGNYFHWRTGGDGDNGETLMYQMDAFFELLDKIEE